VDVSEASKIIHNQLKGLFEVEHQYRKEYPDLKWIGQQEYSGNYERLGDSQIGTVWKTPKGELCFTTEEKIWEQYFEACRTMTDTAAKAKKDLRLTINDSGIVEQD
jgi:hypothetical protein